MRKRIITFALLLCSCNLWADHESYAIFIGPMIHFDSDGKKRVTLELSYWRDPKQGIDVGIDFKNGIIYSELQTGAVFAGVSVGPYFKFKGKKTIGMQSTLWANVLIGVDYRFRSGDMESTNGVYFKLPVTGDYTPDSSPHF